ncbi:ankyrin repeat-containing domain protein [Aspergillus pseudoustus]|uniref:Ankyrin repeat-containing domain protein n=1 Tax=Aspergillus pseudoustus TaxID=1810923 RepID=A0ABR4ILI4_9EURO
MSLSALPTELLVQIVNFVDCLQALHALALTNRHFYTLADPRLYQQDAQGSRLAMKWAAAHGKIDLMKKSLNHGAQVPSLGRFVHLGEVNIREGQGKMTTHTFPVPAPQTHPLRLAIDNGHADITELLLDRGCDASMINHQRTAALCLAVANGHTDIARILLARGARQESPLPLHQSFPIELAALQGDQEMVEVLLRGSTLSRPSPGQMHTALECALLGEHLHLLPLLLLGESDIRLDFYFQNKDLRSRYQTPLRWAVTAGQLEIVRAMLDKGADPNFPNGWGSPPILAAVKAGSEETVRLLAPVTHRIHVTRALALSMEQAGADADADGDGCMAKLLLASGAKPDFEPRDSLLLTGHHHGECRLGMGDELVPPLIAAVGRGREALVRLLVAHGADVNVGYSQSRPTTEKNVPDGFMGAPLLLAMQLGHEGIAAFLREKGGREEAGTWEELMRTRFSKKSQEEIMKWPYKRPSVQ